jgi:pimeloyl-ACP methyl ester carboxylesterase
MLMNLSANLVVMVAQLYLLTVPEAVYRRKLEAIPSMDHKNDGLNLLGWTYEKIHSDSLNMDHYFYHYPSEKPDAPVMFFVHGLNLDGKTYLRLKPLARDYELIAYDFPESTTCYKGNIDDFTVLLADFLRVKKIDTAIVCAISAGGVAAVRMIATQPQVHVPKLILISSVLGGSSDMSPRTQRRISRFMSKLPDYKMYRFVEILYGRFAQADANRPDSLSHLIDLRIKHPSWYRELFAASSSYDESEDAGKIRCPTLVVNGRKDKLAGPAQGARLRAAIPGAVGEVVPDAGHAIPVTHPDFMVDRIRRFLESGT